MTRYQGYGVVRKQVGQLIHRHGSLRKCARALDISPAYLSRLFRGKKDELSDAILRKMGLRKIITYAVLS